MPRGVYVREVKTLADRFWPKVDVRGPEECWPWLAFRKRSGYGSINEAGHDGRPLQAHRVAWELTNGPIPDGLFVCHRCDNPPCCNPAHLFLGTHAENMADAVSKDRIPFGEARPGAVLTEERVREIHAMREGGALQREIAERFGLSRRYVSSVLTGARWRRLAS